MSGPGPAHGHELTQVAKGAGITFVGRGVGAGLQYLSLILFARVLGTERMGLYLLGMTIANIAGVAAKLGLDKGILRFVPLHAADPARIKGTLLYAFKVAGGLSALIGIAIAASSGLLADRFFHKPALAPVLRVFSLSLPFYVLFVLSLFAMQAVHAIKQSVALQQIFLPFCTIALTVAFFFSGAQLSGVLAAYTISLIAATFLSFYLLRKTIPALKDSIRPVYEGGTLLRYSLPLVLAMFLNFSLLWTDVLMLGYYRTSSEVGVYSVAVKTALLPNLILVAFNAIFTPMMSDLFHRNELTKVAGLFKTVTRWIFLMSFPYTLIVALLSKEIMGLFSLEFAVGWVSLILLVCSQLISATTGPVIEILTMSGKQMVTLYNEIAAVVLNVLLNLFLIPRFGMMGAAIATGIAWAALNVMSLIQVHLRYRIHPYERAFFKPLLAGVVAFVLLFQVKLFLRDGLELSKLPVMLIVSGLFLAVYLGLLFRMGLSQEDRFILEKFRGRFGKAPRTLSPSPLQESDVR